MPCVELKISPGTLPGRPCVELKILTSKPPGTLPGRPCVELKILASKPPGTLPGRPCVELKILASKRNCGYYRIDRKYRTYRTRDLSIESIEGHPDNSISGQKMFKSLSQC